jgi:hypothetical protein
MMQFTKTLVEVRPLGMPKEGAPTGWSRLRDDVIG